jgi:hypothetical protein
MKIIADNGPLGEFLDKAFAPLNNHDGVIVFVEHAVKRGFRSELHGLDDTLAHAPSGVPVVMLAWQSLFMMADDSRLHAALGYSNVVFRRLPEGIVEVMAAVEEATERKRIPDPLAITLLTAENSKRDVQILQHDLHSAETNGGERMALWEERARTVFGDKPQAELIEAAKQARQDDVVAGQFAGRTFPDVCIDVEGTLFTTKSEFREDTLIRAKELASAEGRPITIWTGGDLEAAKKMVRKAGIPYKLASKHLFRGATIGVAFDDMPHEAFSETYGIGYGNYQQV